jgi:hypothetical protein
MTATGVPELAPRAADGHGDGVGERAGVLVMAGHSPDMPCRQGPAAGDVLVSLD